MTGTASYSFGKALRGVAFVALTICAGPMSHGFAGEGAQTQTPHRQVSAEEKQRIVKMLQDQIIRCWSPPPGASESGVQATISMELNPDGTLKSEPRVETVKHPGSPFADMIAKSAIRAVKMCAKAHPFKLPVEAYDVWAGSHITFDPKSL